MYSEFVQAWRDRVSRALAGLSERSSLDETIASARSRVARAAECGRVLSPDIVDPILTLARKSENEPISQDEERQFYIAYGTLSSQIADIGQQSDDVPGQPFDNAVSDAEQLLQHAASIGVDVPDDVVLGILNARTALTANNLTSDIRARFYGSYTKLSSSFGDVTAETIRNCTSRTTRRHLRRLSRYALAVTAMVAVMSVVTFITDQTSKRIADSVKTGNELAAQLRGEVFDARNDKRFDDPKYTSEPCQLLLTEPDLDNKIDRSIDKVTLLQKFAANNRDLRSSSIKLNTFNSTISFGQYYECDPFGACRPSNGTETPAQLKEEAVAQFELQPTIKNFAAEVFCKIKTFQEVRSYGSNVNSNYTAIFGALLSFILPVFYALLGALAYQLRSFSDAVQKRVYRRSFSHSARIITAVIAGSIVSLFNPAKSLEISPLATAFLVGYGVEIFFRFIDSLMSSIGSGSSSAAKPSGQA